MLRYSQGRTVYLGSGVSVDNFDEVMDGVDGAIVGSFLKKNHLVKNEVDLRHVNSMRKKFDNT